MQRFIIFVLVGLLIIANVACERQSNIDDALESDFIGEDDEEVVTPEDDSEVTHDEVTYDNDWEPLYQPVIERYRQSLEEDLDEKNRSAGPVDLLGNRSQALSYAYNSSHAVAGYIISTFYFAYFDIDENGIPELLISDEKRDSKFIDVYTIFPNEEVRSVFFGGYAWHPVANRNNVSLVKNSEGLYFVVDLYEETMSGIDIYIVSENCTELKLAEKCHDIYSFALNPGEAIDTEKVVYFQNEKEITKTEYWALREKFTGETIFYDWKPVHDISDDSPYNGAQLPEKLQVPKYYSTIDALNVHTGPGTDQNIIRVLKKGDYVLVLGEMNEDDGWAFIIYSIEFKVNCYGWVSKDFLSTN